MHVQDGYLINHRHWRRTHAGAEKRGKEVAFYVGQSHTWLSKLAA